MGPEIESDVSGLGLSIPQSSPDDPPNSTLEAVNTPLPIPTPDEDEEEQANDIENDIENGPVIIPQSLLIGTHLVAAPSTAMANQDVDASDADTRANFSFEVRGQDDISTLADTVAESTYCIQFLPPMLNVYAHAHPTVPMELPLRHFALQHQQSKEMGGQGRTIQLVPTEDTSHGSPKDQSRLEIEEVKQIPRSNIRRTVFWISLILAPVILITLVVLAVMLIRLRQDQLSSTSNGAQASPPTENEGLNGTFPFSDLTDSPSISSPTLANAFTSPPPTSLPTSLSMTNLSSDFPSSSPTESPTENPTDRPTDNPTLSPTLSPVVVATPSPTLALTPSPTLRLTSPSTMSPTAQVTSSDTAVPTLSSTSSQTIDLTTEPVAQPPFPNLRFVPWQQFRSNADSGLRDAVINGLGYDQFTWNNPGTASIESSTYQDIVQRGTFFSTPLQVLGFDTSPVWNCWVNHYFEFNWDDLPRLPSASEAISDQDLVSANTAYGLQVQEAWRALGWTASSWESSNSANWPSSQSKSWSELTTAERQAAQVLCYNQELWDQVPIPRW